METQDQVLIVGDGPCGLSCGLLLAKNGIGCHVLGEARTPMEKAMLHNLLGSDGLAGPTFMELARLHAETAGIHLHRQTVATVTANAAGDGYVARTQEGNAFEAKVLVLANGRDTGLAQQLGLELRDGRVAVDLDGRTSRDGVYAGGWLTRGHKTQAAIAIGDGAAIALDILSLARGSDFHDFDVLKPSHGAPASRDPRRERRDRDEHDERTPRVEQPNADAQGPARRR